MSVPSHTRTPAFCVRFEVFTALTVKNAVFWDVTPGGCCKNRRFGGTYLHHQCDICHFFAACFGC
jgi:hypothetical protein